MAAGVYNILAEQGTSFSLHLRYSDCTGNYVDLSDYNARMQVRRSPNSDSMLLHITNTGVTGGGVTGEFSSDGGVLGTGGISVNAPISGSGSLTGGLLIEVDPTTMSNCPHGNHFYDLEIVDIDSGAVVRLIEGRFTVDREITR